MKILREQWNYLVVVFNSRLGQDAIPFDKNRQLHKDANSNPLAIYQLCEKRAQASLAYWHKSLADWMRVCMSFTTGKARAMAFFSVWPQKVSMRT